MAPAKHRFSTDSYRLVVEGVIVARGRRDEMHSARKRAKREGKTAFVGLTSKQIGEKW